MRLGMICRMDQTGLGQGQTLRLARLLHPDKVLLIHSTIFNGNKQFPEWYKDYNTTTVNGFIADFEVRRFLEGLDVVISCETFYNNSFTRIAKEMGVKTILIANPEFFDYFKPEWSFVPLSDKVVVPSQWLMDKMKPFNPTYLPTPIFDDEFVRARETNLKRTGKRRFLFDNGKQAAHDRNGLESLYDALPLCKGDFEIVVKSQGEVKRHPDPRLTYDISNPDEQWKIFNDYDAMILPRRYAGQSLPMCQALVSGLPVIMTDISPNNDVLPKEWLVESDRIAQFMTRTMIDIYAARPEQLAMKIDWFAGMNDGLLFMEKEEALSLSREYDAETLRPSYEKMIREVTQ